jgi:hypothetical protein
MANPSPLPDDVDILAERFPLPQDGLIRADFTGDNHDYYYENKTTGESFKCVDTVSNVAKSGRFWGEEFVPETRALNMLLNPKFPHPPANPKWKDNYKAYRELTTLWQTKDGVLLDAWRKGAVTRPDAVRAILDSWNERAAVGTRMHTDIEMFIKGKRDPNEPRTVEFQQALDRIAYLEKERGMTPLRVEVDVCHLTSRIGGRIDAIFTDAKNPVDGQGRLRVWLVDWKHKDVIVCDGRYKRKGVGLFAKDFANDGSTFAFAMNLYATMLEDSTEGGIVVVGIMLVRVHNTTVDSEIIDLVRNTKRTRAVLDMLTYRPPRSREEEEGEEEGEEMGHPRKHRKTTHEREEEEEEDCL